jgi:hypothetical protein
VGSVGGKRFGCARDATCHSILRRYTSPRRASGPVREQAVQLQSRPQSRPQGGQIKSPRRGGG